MTAPRVLMVDDDPLLLSSFQRAMSGGLELDVAESGDEALERLRSAVYSVVVTDMRMPRMDGLQLIEAGRIIAPQTTFVMLTGNNDQKTATDAVNCGQVFKFLTKPCTPDSLTRTIHEAHERQRRLQAEKAMLSQALAGAVGLMSDVLEANRPGIGAHLHRLTETVERLRVAIEMAPSWEIKVASRLALVGFACLGDHAARTFFGANPADDSWREVFAKATEIGARLVLRVPRLEAVSEMITLAPETNGSCDEAQRLGADPVVAIGATLLHTAIVWDALDWQGLRQTEAINEVHRLMPKLQPRFLDGLRDLAPRDEHRPTIILHPDDLTPGMVLREDIVVDGATLLRSGSRLSETLICKLRDLVSQPSGPHEIVVIDPDSLATHTPTG